MQKPMKKKLKTSFIGIETEPKLMLIRNNKTNDNVKKEKKTVFRFLLVNLF